MNPRVANRSRKWRGEETIISSRRPQRPQDSTDHNGNLALQRPSRLLVLHPRHAARRYTPPLHSLADRLPDLRTMRPEPPRRRPALRHHLRGLGAQRAGEAAPEVAGQAGGLEGDEDWDEQGGRSGGRGDGGLGGGEEQLQRGDILAARGDFEEGAVECREGGEGACERGEGGCHGAPEVVL